MPQLDPTWFASQIFWLVIGFATFYLVLSRVILHPLQDVIARRGQTITGDIDRAQRLKSQAEEARETYERALANARAQAQQLLNDMEAEYAAAAERANKDMDKQIEQKLAEAAKKITAKKNELFAALTPTAETLAAMIVEKLIRKTVGSDRAKSAVSAQSKGNR